MFGPKQFFLVISDFSDNPDVPHACLMSLFMISKQRYNFYEIKSITVADLGGAQEAWGPPPPPYFGKKEEITKGRIASRASKTTTPSPSPPLAQGLDLPLSLHIFMYYHFISITNFTDHSVKVACMSLSMITSPLWSFLWHIEYMQVGGQRFKNLTRTS